MPPRTAAPPRTGERGTLFLIGERLLSLRPRRTFRLVVPLTGAAAVRAVIYPDGTTEILVRTALFERAPGSLISGLLAVPDMTLPASIVQLIPLAPIFLTALLIGRIALASPRIILLASGRLVAFLVLAHAVPSNW